MQKTRNYISYDQDNTLQTSFGPCSFEVKRKMPWSDILLPRRAWWHIHRWQGFNLLSEQRERNPLMLMRKHLIEQRGAASLKHSLDPKLCMQDPARPVGPADRVQRGSCWDYKRRWTGTNLLLRGDPVTIHVPWRGLCDSWQISTFIPTVLKETSKWFTSTESQSDVGEKRSLSLTINPALLNPPLNHVPKWFSLQSSYPPSDQHSYPTRCHLQTVREHSILLSTSLIKISTRTDPNTEPRGTPFVTGWV